MMKKVIIIRGEEELDKKAWARFGEVRVVSSLEALTEELVHLLDESEPCEDLEEFSDSIFEPTFH